MFLQSFRAQHRKNSVEFQHLQTIFCFFFFKAYLLTGFRRVVLAFPDH